MSNRPATQHQLDSLLADVLGIRGNLYMLAIGMWVGDGQMYPVHHRKCIVLCSPKWRTITLQADEFRQYAVQVDDFL